MCLWSHHLFNYGKNKNLMNIPLYWTIEWIYHWIKRNIKFHSFSPYFILWKKNYKTLVLTIKPFCSSLSRSSWRNTKKFFRDLLRSTHQLKLKQKNNVCVYIIQPTYVCVYICINIIYYIFIIFYIYSMRLNNDVLGLILILPFVFATLNHYVV